MSETKPKAKPTTITAPFVAKPTCIKCGEEDYGLAYSPSQTGRMFEIAEIVITNDHLTYQCNCCGYIWQTVTKDAPQGDGQ